MCQTMLACYSSGSSNSTMPAVWNNCFSSLFIINQICFCSVTDWKWCIEIAVIRTFMPISLAYIESVWTNYFQFWCVLQQCESVQILISIIFLFQIEFLFDKVLDFEFNDWRAMLAFEIHTYNCKYLGYSTQ